MADHDAEAPRVLFTGGRGFVGSALLELLAARRPGWPLVAPGGPGQEDAIDVCDASAVEDWIRREKPDVVVHLAAVAAVTASEKDPRQAWDVNLTGTLNLVLAMREHRPGAHLLHVSTAEVYGASASGPEPLDELTLLQPVNPYAASKAAADILVRQVMAEGMSATLMRPFNQIGPGQSDAFAIASFAAQIARIEAGLQPPTISVGALDEERDFLAVEDVVDAYALAVEHREGAAKGAVFNVCSGETRRVGDVLAMLIALSPATIEVRIDPARLRRSPTPRVAGDASHIRRTLGWKPQRPLAATLHDVLQAQRARLQHG